MAAVAAGFLLWNVWLTLRLYDQRPAETAELRNEGPEDVTVTTHTIEGYITDITETVAEERHKTVTISTVNEQEERIFSGVIYSVMGTDVWILSSSSATQGEGELYVVRFDNGLSYEAELRGTDELLGIALFLTHPEFDVEAIDMGSSLSLAQGEYAIALGGRNLHTGIGETSFGVVSMSGQKYVSGEEQEWIREEIHTDLRISSEMEGGPLLNLSGQMIGLLYAETEDGERQLNRAAGISEVLIAAEQLRRNGEVNRGYLGVITRDLKDLELYQKSAMNLPLDQNSGLVIMEVIVGSPAQEAGLQANDILVSADEVLLSAEDSLRKVLYSHESGDVINLSVIHGGASNALSVELK